MRTKLWLGVIFSTSALVACGGGGNDPDAPIVPQIDSPPGTPDGRPDADPLAPDAAPEFACAGQSIPTTGIPTSLVVSGDVAEVGTSGSTPRADVPIAAYRVGMGAAVANTTSAATTGAYSITIDNPSMTPADGYLLATPGNRCGTAGNAACKNVYLTPPTAIYRDIPAAPIRTVSNANFDLLTSLLAQVTQDPAKGVIAMIVTDCLNNPLAGATVSSTAGVEIIYNGDNGLPSPAATATAADGIGYVFNVPVGSATVDAVYMGMDFRAHTLAIHASGGADNALNTTTVTP